MYLIDEIDKIKANGGGDKRMSADPSMHQLGLNRQEILNLMNLSEQP